MHSLLPARACLARPELRIGSGSRLAGVLRSPLPRICNLPWLPGVPSRKLSVPAQALRKSEDPHPANQDLENFNAMLDELEEIHLLRSRSQGGLLVHLVLEMKDWDWLDHDIGEQLTQALLQCLGMGGEAEDARQLSSAAFSLAVFKLHLTPSAATSAFSAFIRHCASSEAMKKGSWRDWSQLLHALAYAGVQCSDVPELTKLCDQAAKLLPKKFEQSMSYKGISMPLSAMVAVGYRGYPEALLRKITAAINQGRIMETACFDNWRELIMADKELSGSGAETGQLVMHFSVKASDSMDDLDAEDVSTLMNAMCLAYWPHIESFERLAERAAGQPRRKMNSSQLAISLCSMAFLGYMDSSVRRLAAKVAKADLTAFKPQDLTNLLNARCKFLAWLVHQAVSSGHSQLASELELNSMAAALWRECSRREAVGQQWSRGEQEQIQFASYVKDACTGVQTSLTASPPSPSLKVFVAMVMTGGSSLRITREKEAELSVEVKRRVRDKYFP